MPYIPNAERKLYDVNIKSITDKLLGKLPGDNGKNYNVGDLNYIISSIIWKLFDVNPSYKNGNNLVGVLECVKLEFLRRRLNSYEDSKIIQHGDLSIE